MIYTRDDVGPYKNVDGVDVLMSNEERSAVAERWNNATPMEKMSLVDSILADPEQVAALKAAIDSTGPSAKPLPSE